MVGVRVMVRVRVRVRVSVLRPTSIADFIIVAC